MLSGRVVNDTKSEGRAKKTVVVEVVRRFRDPFYGKYVKRRRRLHAHDEREQYRKDDLVEIHECRPYSATKRWVAVRLLERPPEV
ncbi:MAG: 30S ribosomal protein S17 [Polyangiales bacterium]